MRLPTAFIIILSFLLMISPAAVVPVAAAGLTIETSTAIEDSARFEESFPVAYAPALQSLSACLMDAQSGQILYGKDMDRVMYPASITKIMTALLALEKGNLSDMITMSHEAVFSIERGSSHIALGCRRNDQPERCLVRSGHFRQPMMLPMASRSTSAARSTNLTP